MNLSLFIKFISFFIRKFKNLIKRLVFSILPKRVRYKKRLSGLTSYSQAGQDVFVRAMLSNMENGYYVELGAFDSVWDSNTYFLESQLGWKGISFEIEGSLVKKFNQERKNICFEADATKLDYAAIFEKENVPSQVHYLSLDIEPADQTLATLRALPLEKYRFSVITYEHDNYVSGPACMNEARKILEKHGYFRVISNLNSEGRDFEDWWVDPEAVDEKLYQEIISQNVEYQEIIKRLNRLNQYD